MPRDADKTRKRILDAAYGQFRRRGYSRVSMDEIAGATKVTKRTLYYHFESKDALLTAVLEAQHQLALDAFRTFGDGLTGSVEADFVLRGLAVGIQAIMPATFQVFSASPRPRSPGPCHPGRCAPSRVRS